MTITANDFSTAREQRRAELAALLDRDVASLADNARLVEDLALDSLAMLSLMSWLESRGVVLDAGRKRPASVAELLSLVDKARTLQVRITSPAGERLGPADVPARADAGPADPLVPELEDRQVRLLPVVPADVEFLYDLTVRPENCFRWRYRGLPPSFERFAGDLWQAVMVQFVVRRASDGERIGHVVAYAANPSLQYCYLGALFLPQYAGTGIPAHAVALFARYLFHTCPFKKLYLEVPGYNWDQLRSGEDRLFTVEGVLCEHIWYAGRHWDEYVCAIYRDGPPA